VVILAAGSLRLWGARIPCPAATQELRARSVRSARARVGVPEQRMCVVVCSPRRVRPCCGLASAGTDMSMACILSCTSSCTGTPASRSSASHVLPAPRGCAFDVPLRCQRSCGPWSWMPLPAISVCRRRGASWWSLALQAASLYLASRTSSRTRAGRCMRLSRCRRPRSRRCGHGVGAGLACVYAHEWLRLAPFGCMCLHGFACVRTPGFARC